MAKNIILPISPATFLEMLRVEPASSVRTAGSISPDELHPFEVGRFDLGDTTFVLVVREIVVQLPGDDFARLIALLGGKLTRESVEAAEKN